jgi:hypothetical protein
MLAMPHLPRLNHHGLLARWLVPAAALALPVTAALAQPRVAPPPPTPVALELAAITCNVDVGDGKGDSPSGGGRQMQVVGDPGPTAGAARLLPATGGANATRQAEFRVVLRNLHELLPADRGRFEASATLTAGSGSSALKLTSPTFRYQADVQRAVSFDGRPTVQGRQTRSPWRLVVVASGRLTTEAAPQGREAKLTVRCALPLS